MSNGIEPVATDARPSGFRFGITTLVWIGALTLYLNSLLDLTDAAAARLSTRPFAAITADIGGTLSRSALPVAWFLAFAVALILSSTLLPPEDRSTLRWLRQAWLGTLITYIGGLTMLPRGLLLIDLALLVLSVEGVRIASTALVRHLLDEPDVA